MPTPIPKLPKYSGPSILEMMWAELETTYSKLKLHGTGDTVYDLEDLGLLKGQCIGLATALSILYNPYNPQIDVIRAEAEERWKKANP